jgi:hypothetical protein
MAWHHGRRLQEASEVWLLIECVRGPVLRTETVVGAFDSEDAAFYEERRRLLTFSREERKRVLYRTDPVPVHTLVPLTAVPVGLAEEE